MELGKARAARPRERRRAIPEENLSLAATAFGAVAKTSLSGERVPSKARSGESATLPDYVAARAAAPLCRAFSGEFVAELAALSRCNSRLRTCQ